MAGKIVADTLEHSTAGSLDTQYVVDGSIKSWVNFTGTGTVTVEDSLNIASITDAGTGIYTVDQTSNFANANYTITHGGLWAANNGWFHYYNGKSTTGVSLNFITSVGAATDSADVSGNFVGDLA